MCAHRRHTLVTMYFGANADERSNPKVDVHRSNKSRAKTPDAYQHFLRRPKPKNFQLRHFIFLWLWKKLASLYIDAKKDLTFCIWDQMAWCALPFQMVLNNLPDFWEDRATTRAGSISQGRPAAEDSSYTFMATWEKGEFQVQRPIVTANSKSERHLPSCQFHEECGLWSLPRSSPGRECGRTAPGEKDTSVIRAHLC